MGPYSPWRFRLVDQQPASGLLDRGILVSSSAILPLAMLEPKYSTVPRLLCSLRALRESPNRSPSSISTNNSHNDAEVCATLNQMLANEKRRPSTFGANLLPICKTIQLMVANGKQEIVHFSGRCTKHLTIQCTTEIRSPMLHPNTAHYRIATSCTSHVRTHCH